MPKVHSRSRSAAAERKHNPLADDILNAGHLRTKPVKKRTRRVDDEDAGNDFIDAKTSRKILQIGQDLAEEEAAEQRAASGESAQRNTAFDFSSRLEDDEQLSEDEDKFEDDEWGDEEVEEVEVDPNDLDTFNKFLPSGDQDPIFNSGEADQGPGTNLTSLILEKIEAYEAQQASKNQSGGQGGAPPEGAVQLPAKAVEVFSKVGHLLSRYKSGPFPKPFKILPTLPHWNALLDVTRPENWTPNAVFGATRIFISSKPAIAQEFINTVLLERVREDIHENRKLNVHLYNSLRKALFKPACFFKGLLFPLVQSGTCTIREAHIIASVIARVSIPVLHSAAALLRLCEIVADQTAATLSSEGTGAANIFIKTLLEKKYALPYKVIDALVFHFLRFRAMDRPDDPMAVDSKRPSGSAAVELKLPVIWHQCLLAFAQRYRNDITEDQREALLDLLLVRGHKDISPEIRRELLAGRGRGVVVPDPETEAARAAGDDTMDTSV